jgi:Membrane bound beta barrel domain (DUF5777)
VNQDRNFKVTKSNHPFTGNDYLLETKTHIMKRYLILGNLFFALNMAAQDTTMNSLMKDMDNKKDDKLPVKIFNSGKAINANTTEVVGKGKMDFKVTHNFGDIGGTNGGIKNFFGLDNASDIRIAFEMGLGKRFDLTAARTRGAGPVQSLWELGLKYQLMRQLENDPTHPLSIAIFTNAVVCTKKRNRQDNQDNSFSSFSERTSNIIQLIVARKMGKISLQLNPTFSTRGYAISYDQKSIFALGGAIKVPISANFNLVVDYFHCFRNQNSKDSFLVNQNIKFFDPLGVGFEIITAGHIFHLNFTNATEILENRFIPRTISSWGKGQFRWGFTISRKFSLWKEKK